MLAAVIRSEPDWAAFPPNLHWRLREVIERCLQKIPGIGITTFPMSWPTFAGFWVIPAAW